MLANSTRHAVRLQAGIHRSFPDSGLKHSRLFLQMVRSTTMRYLIEASLDPFLIIGRDGKISDANRAALDMTGLPRKLLIGSQFAGNFTEPSRAHEVVRIVFDKGATRDHFLEIKHIKGFATPVMVNAAVSRNDQKEVIGAVAVARDISALKQVERELAELKDNLEKLVYRRTCELEEANHALQQEIARREQSDRALRSAHQQLQDIIEFLPDPTFVIDASKRVIAWNRAIETISGVSKEEILGRGDYAYSIPFYGIPRPVLIDLVFTERSDLEAEYYSIERRGFTVCGEAYVPGCYGGAGAYMWGTASVLFDQDGNVLGAIESIRDISERKKTRDAILNSRQELRRLSKELLRAQEEERRRLARDLHDSIGQSLAALKFHVEAARHGLSKGETAYAVQALDLLVPKIQTVIQEARDIYMGLRPSMLDDLGIIATLQWHCREFRRSHPDIRLEARVTLDEEDIPESLKIVIYRIVQEALFNLSKHSGAKHVFVSMTKTEGILELMIEDNGAGFDVNEARKRNEDAGGLGITGMRERVELSGGTFYIESHPHEGTTVWAGWPLSNL